MKAIETVSDRLGVGQLVPLVALPIVVGGPGQAGAWFAAGGRLPFVAGLDRFLPAAFGRIHPRYGSPLAAIGFGVTSIWIGLALIPAEDEPNKALAVTKVAGLTILLVATGALVYFIGTRRGYARR